MKTLLLIFCLTTPGLAAKPVGPLFQHKDQQIHREFQELYNGLRSSGTAVYFYSKTLAQLKAQTPVDVGEAWYCSTCVTDTVCVSTTSGPTGIGGYSRFSARGTACQ